jgi:hypothetical protein
MKNWHADCKEKRMCERA